MFLANSPKAKTGRLPLGRPLVLVAGLALMTLSVRGQCPPGAEVVKVQDSSTETRTTCRCLPGYVRSGNQCVPKVETAPPVDLDKPVDPGALVTPDIYQSAKSKYAELQTLESKILQKQTELSKWRGDLIAEKREFDRLHAEAAHGELAEVIQIIPAEAVVGQLLAQGKITVESAEKLKASFERLKAAGKAVANATEAKDERELVKVQIDATNDTIKALIAAGKDLPLDSPERVWDSRTVKMLGMFAATGKSLLGNPQPNDAKWWEQAEPAAQLLADLGGIAVPPLGVAVKTERLIDREARKQIISRAQNSLGGAIADNWNANVYLSQKLVRVRSDMSEQQRTIQAYEGRNKN